MRDQKVGYTTRAHQATLDLSSSWRGGVEKCVTSVGFSNPPHELQSPGISEKVTEGAFRQISSQARGVWVGVQMADPP